jgi:succinate-semialdehyde dehydrogenase/glutarate-semialdehyde dehydrogenase
MGLAAAGGTKRTSLELGGNAPFLLFADAFRDEADLKERVLPGLLRSKLRASGQTCVCVNRVLVEASVMDRVTASLVEILREGSNAPGGPYRMGHGLDPDVRLGPLLRRSDVAKTLTWLDSVKAKSDILFQADLSHVLRDPLLATGHFLPVTVLRLGSDAAGALQGHELFAPVIVLQTFTSLEQAISLANSTRAGLAAYVYSSNASTLMTCSRRLDFGMIGLNESMLTSVEVPFGGMKESGFGKEGGREGIAEYQHSQLVVLSH